MIIILFCNTSVFRRLIRRTIKKMKEYVAIFQIPDQFRLRCRRIIDRK
jgi:hypothetical protein